MSVTRTAKEMTRDLIAKAGLARLHVSIRKLSGQNVDHLFPPSLSERFAAIYKNRVWLTGRAAGSLSGLGSDFANTQNVRHGLSQLLESLHTRSLLDIGCGDFTWMKEVRLLCEYIGLDIVEEVVRANNACYRSEERSFQVLDATADPLPRADTVLCREVLFHLSFRDIWRVFKNVRKSSASFLIATNDNDLKYNADILSGDFRMLNLHKSPFYLPSPQQSIPDAAVVEGRTLAAWRIADLPDRP